MRISILLVLLILFTPAQAEEHAHGLVSKNTEGQQLAWNANKEAWVTLDNFWQTFSQSTEAKHWGKTSNYPTYSRVREFDTILIEVEQGSCLMQFFHSRWRRANDVQRWDDAFNSYSGCPYVFD